MKKTILCAALFLLNGLAMKAQTAVDFTANDCSSNSYHLFADLDAGKVVIITFVMPCSVCLGPSQTAFSAAQSYSTSNPGKVVFFLATNGGFPACSVLTNWAVTNSIYGVTCFSDASIKESDYGATAMPKTVVLAGPNHQVIYKEDGTLNNTNLKAAIDGFFNPASVSQTIKTVNSFNVYPNPAQNKVNIDYTLGEQADVNIDIINVAGVKVKALQLAASAAGDHTVALDLTGEGFANGNYFARIKAGKQSQSLMFTINR